MGINDIKNEAAESAVVATVIKWPSVTVFSEQLKPHMFTDKFAGAVYLCVVKLFESGVNKITEMNLELELRRNKNTKEIFESCGIDLDQYMTLSASAVVYDKESYLKFVNDIITCSFKRELYRNCDVVKSICCDDTATLKDIDTTVEKEINGITQSYILTSDVEMLGTKVDDLFNTVTSDEAKGLPCKFKLLENYISIPANGDFLGLIVGRLKEGKSAFMMNMAVYMAQHGVPVLYLDTELTTTEFYKRLIVYLSGVEYGKLRKQTYTEDELDRLKAASDSVKKLPIIHHFLPVFDMDEITALVRLSQSKYQVGVCFCDYLKSDATDTNSSSTNYNRLGRMASFLKDEISAVYSIPIIAGAQLNRQGQVSDSDKLQRYCSCSINVGYITADQIEQMGDDPASYGDYYYKVTVNRNGGRHDENEFVSCFFLGDKMQIFESEKQPNGKLNPFNDGKCTTTQDKLTN